MKQKLPNQITMARIFMIPLFVILFYIPGAESGSWQWTLASIVFAIASFTDWLDGYLARKWKVVSNFGKFADPLADKMLNMVAFVVLVAFNIVPIWAVAIIICRELAVTGLRLLLVEQGGVVMAAAMPGKIKTATQMVSVILLLLAGLSNIFMILGLVFFYICVFFTIYSGYDYFKNSMFVFKSKD